MGSKTVEFLVDVTPSSSDFGVLSEAYIEQINGSVVPLSINFGRKIGTAKLHVDGDKVMASCVIDEVDELATVRMALLGNVSIADVCQFGLAGVVRDGRFDVYEVGISAKHLGKKE